MPGTLPALPKTARTLPHALRTLRADSDDLSELSVLCGFDDDLTAQITRVQNRIRSLLTQDPPSPGEGHGPPPWACSVRELLARHPSPAQLAAELRALAPRMYRRLARDIMPAPV